MLIDNVNIEKIAKLCHEVNKAYCHLIGDDSQLPWNAAPEWQKDSARNGVRFTIENPTAKPSASHENWLKVKLDDGWKFGPVKDVEKKEHPCCVPYEQLPEDQRRKDALFQGVVRAMTEGI
jgi:hypothetical protein